MATIIKMIRKLPMNVSQRQSCMNLIEIYIYYEIKKIYNAVITNLSLLRVNTIIQIIYFIIAFVLAPLYMQHSL
jgi:hypothetical protein